MKPGELLHHPTERQFRDFKRERDSGATTFFRTRLCNNCQTQVPSAYECCSVACYSALQAKEPAMSINHPNLEQLIGSKVSIETREGAIQTGKATKINYIEVSLFGQVVKSPKSIEFNNDASEFADWNLIKTIKRI